MFYVTKGKQNVHISGINLSKRCLLSRAILSKHAEKPRLFKLRNLLRNEGFDSPLWVQFLRASGLKKNNSTIFFNNSCGSGHECNRERAWSKQGHPGWRHPRWRAVGTECGGVSAKLFQPKTWMSSDRPTADMKERRISRNHKKWQGSSSRKWLDRVFHVNDNLESRLHPVGRL